MIQNAPGLLAAIRDRFAHVDACPYQGPRAYFENAGGALTLKSVVARSGEFAAIPDNQGRDNPASKAMMAVIARAKADMRLLMNASGGQVFVGESGTELLFRLLRAACRGAAAGGEVVSSTLEHPASRSAARRGAEAVGARHRVAPHDWARGVVSVADYAPHIGPDTRVATVVHTSPVTGMGVDVAAIAAAIRAVSPDCLIIVDGIQHAAHGALDIDAYGIDGYVISPYKAFSRHGYGVAWISDRLAALPHDLLIDAPATGWELGTRDAGAYATFSEVVRYVEWLGAQVSDARAPRARIEAAGAAIRAQEHALTEALLHGTGNLPGLADTPGVEIIGGVDNPAREGLASFTHRGVSSADIVASLNAQGVRTHMRKADHYSANVLTPLGLEDCVRVSLCHYNSLAEIAQFLAAMKTALT